MAIGDDILEKDGYYPSFDNVTFMNIKEIEAPPIITFDLYCELMSKICSLAVDFALEKGYAEWVTEPRICEDEDDIGYEADMGPHLTFNRHVWPVIIKESFK